MINAWGITDKGVVRTQNQDGYYLDVPSEHLAVGVVCDGMGGLAKGEVASAAMVHVLADWFTNSFPVLLSNGFDAEALRLDWERSHRSRTVVLRSGGRTVSLPTADIRYIESINRSAVVHLTEGERSFPLTMAQMERLTPADAFARCHNSFLVNLAHVAEAGRAGVRLRDGEQLPVGRRYYQSFQTAFIRYLNQ